MSELESELRPRGRLFRDLLLVAAMVALVVVHNAWWLHRDTLNPLWDEAQYLLNSLEVLDAVQHPGSSSLAKLYHQRVGTRPTFFFVGQAVPYYLLFGSAGDVAILGVNTLFLLVIALATYGLGRQVFDRRVALLATALVLLNAQISTLSRIFWPHLSVVAVAAAGTWLLFRSERLTRRREVLAFGAVLGVGLMMRPVYPALFLFAPALWVCGAALADAVAAARRDGWRAGGRVVLSRFGLGVVPALLITGVIAGPYYYRILPSMLRFAGAVQEEFSDRWAHRQSYFWYLTNLHVDASLFFVLAVVAGVAAVVWRRRSAASLGLLFAVAVTFLVVSLPSFKSYYYLAPIYPLLAVLAAVWVFELPRGWLRAAATAVLVAGSAVVYAQAAWARPELPRGPLAALLGVVGQPPETAGWHFAEVAEVIRRDAGDGAAPWVGFIADTKMLAPAPFQYLTRPGGDSFRYISASEPLTTLLGSEYAVVRVGRGRLIDARKSRALALTVAARQESDFYRQFKRIAVIRPPERGRISVYRRRRFPARLEEARALLAEALAVDRKAALQQCRQEVPHLEQLPKKVRAALKAECRRHAARAADP